LPANSLNTLAVCAAAALLFACAKGPNPGSRDTTAGLRSSEAEAPAAAAIVEREWALVTLGDSAAPPGSGGKPATIRFDSAAARASGFSGCNRYSAPYTIADDSLHFGVAISTKMACAEGGELERAYLAIISQVTGYQATDSTLALTGSAGTLAGFRAQ
jgi:heat shock protein HslJ